MIVTKQFILVLIVVGLMFYQVIPTQSSTDSSTDNLSNDKYLTDEDQDKGINTVTVSIAQSQPQIYVLPKVGQGLIV